MCVGMCHPALLWKEMWCVPNVSWTSRFIRSSVFVANRYPHFVKIVLEVAPEVHGKPLLRNMVSGLFFLIPGNHFIDVFMNMRGVRLTFVAAVGK